MSANGATRPTYREQLATIQAGAWYVYLAADEDGHLTINATNEDGSDVIDCEVEWPDENEYKVRLTTDKVESDYSDWNTEVGRA